MITVENSSGTEVVKIHVSNGNVATAIVTIAAVTLAGKIVGSIASVELKKLKNMVKEK
jgi:hypothetical protein